MRVGVRRQVAAIFTEYAGILASEGETETALKYIRGQDGSGAVLMDRLVVQRIAYMHITVAVVGIIRIVVMDR